MADTYQNACLVITALAATDGILIPRSSHFINTRTFHDAFGSLNVSITPEIGYDYDSGRQDPLAERGWTMQERFLARRFLSFTKPDMLWECQSHSFYECSTNLDGVKLRRDYDIEAMLRESDREVYRYWNRTVLRYSGRKLTVESDRLPAISAVARRFQARLATRYLAGLWEGNMLLELAWRRVTVHFESGLKQIPSDYRAPSWSWSSINSRCFGSYPVMEDDMRAILVNAQCISATADEFGRVKFGFVVLCGWLAEGWICFPADGKLPYYRVNLYDADQEHRDTEYDLISDSPPELEKRTKPDGSFQTSVKRTNFEYDVDGSEPWKAYHRQPRGVDPFSRPACLAQV
jgi:hypothetical protein